MLPNFKRSDTEPPKVPTSGMSASATPPPRPATPPLRAGTERSAPSVIGPDLIITGNLTSKGEMQIDGEVQGDIRATNLIIGERARITGTIVADEAIIRGQVLGSIRSKRVMLQSSSHVEGDVYHQTLAIEQGAFFEGKSRRNEDPLAGAIPAQSPQVPTAAEPEPVAAAPTPPLLTPSAG
jgi:cytoskeletal protein CcmA (bactofilin family)